MWVSPFGNPRIEAYLQLPEAYRSLSRPSSAPDAKAFALCSFSLELPTYIVCSLNCLSFFVNKINIFSHWKGLSFSCRFLFSTFRWNCNCYPIFWKDSISNKLCPLYLFVFSTHLNPNIWISSFIYSIVKFHVPHYVRWSVWMDSNHRPRAYQARALATWATDRFSQVIQFAPSCWFCLALPLTVLSNRSAGFWTFNSTPSSYWSSLGHTASAIFALRCSHRYSKIGGDEGIRTLDPLLAGQVLSQLSYTPILLGLFLRTQLNPDNWTTKSICTTRNTHLPGFLS